MKMLSFVGTGDYQETIYFYENKAVKTRYVQEALMKIFNPSKVILFVTEAAYKKHGEELEKVLNDVEFVHIEIPKTQDDIWNLFEAIVSSVDEGERIIFDITHAFRHIPFMSFMVLLYLQEVKDVKIEGIYYGAFEAKTERGTPIFDLSGLLELTNWLYGIRDLKRYGRGEGFSNIAQQRRVSKHLVEYPKNISKMLKYLHLNQIPSFMKCSENAKRGYKKFRKEATKFLPPVKPILHEIERLTEFGGCNKLDKECLEKQIRIIEYQLEKGMTANALELMREWIVSAVLYIVGEEDWLKKEVRKNAEDALGWFHAKRIKKNRDKYRKAVYVDMLKENPTIDKLVEVWEKIINIRNSIAHAGMNKDNPKPETIEKRAKEVLNEIKDVLEDMQPVSSIHVI